MCRLSFFSNLHIFGNSSNILSGISIILGFPLCLLVHLMVSLRFLRLFTFHHSGFVSIPQIKGLLQLCLLRAIHKAANDRGLCFSSFVLQLVQSHCPALACGSWPCLTLPLLPVMWVGQLSGPGKGREGYNVTAPFPPAGSGMRLHRHERLSKVENGFY